MTRGRKRRPAPKYPPKGFYRARVEYLQLLRENVISPTEFAFLHALSAFDWRGEGVKVTVSELGRQVGVTRVHASNILKRLAGLGLVTRDGEGRFHLNLRGDGISVNSNLRKMGSLPPTPPIDGGGNHSLEVGDISLSERDIPDRAREEIPPPPPDLSKTPDLRKAEFTQNGIYANSGLHNSRDTGVRGEKPDLLPAIVAACAYIGVETTGGLRHIARLRVGPRALLTWHRERRARSKSEVGSMVNLAREAPDLVRQRISALQWLPWAGRDFCPRCGASWDTYGRPPEVCPECGLELRECPVCHELAPAAEACPYCGASANESPEGDRGEETPEDNVWEQAKATLRERIERRDYNTWLRDTHLVAYEDGEIIVGVSSDFAKEWIPERFGEEVRQALLNVLGTAVQVTYIIDVHRQ